MSKKIAIVLSTLLIIAMIALLALSISATPSSPAHAEDLSIDVQMSSADHGSAMISWGGYDWQGKNFKVYKSSDAGATFESVGMDYKSVSQVRVLQIYPTPESSNQLKDWMETSGFGKGIIKVDAVSIQDFNAAPDTYLKDDAGVYKYDVLFFGAWDANAFQDLSPVSASATEQFIRGGRGVVFGHDTICWQNASTPTLPNFASLAAYAGLTSNDLWARGGFYNLSSSVKVSQSGLITNYPHEIGDAGTMLVIPETHNLGQTSTGTIWMRFAGDGMSIDENDAGNFYVSTSNNCAMIQTGHSGGAATEDEQKVLANLIFFMNQLVHDTESTGDASAQDFAIPNEPQISYSNDNEITVKATDNGTPYKYYVEAYSQADSTLSGLLATSEPKDVLVTSGVEKFLFKCDNEPATSVDASNGFETDETIELAGLDDFQFVHVAAVDGAGNVGPTGHYQLTRYPVSLSASTEEIEPGDSIEYILEADLSSLNTSATASKKTGIEISLSIPEFILPVGVYEDEFSSLAVNDEQLDNGAFSSYYDEEAHRLDVSISSENMESAKGVLTLSFAGVAKDADDLEVSDSSFFIDEENSVGRWTGNALGVVSVNGSVNESEAVPLRIAGDVPLVWTDGSGWQKSNDAFIIALIAGVGFVLIIAIVVAVVIGRSMKKKAAARKQEEARQTFLEQQRARQQTNMHPNGIPSAQYPRNSRR